MIPFSGLMPSINSCTCLPQNAPGKSQIQPEFYLRYLLVPDGQAVIIKNNALTEAFVYKKKLFGQCHIFSDWRIGAGPVNPKCRQ